MDEWIRMADETVVHDAYIVGMDDRIAVYGRGETTFGDVYTMWSNSAKTNRMTSDQYGDIAEWEGYTELYSIEITDSGFVVCLRR